MRLDRGVCNYGILVFSKQINLARLRQINNSVLFYFVFSDNSSKILKKKTDPHPQGKEVGMEIELIINYAYARKHP